VINRGEDGDTLDRFLASRYDEYVAGQPPFDFIFTRYGLNDIHYAKDFKAEYPANYKRLISRLRADHPRAEIVLETVIPYYGEERDKIINEQVRAIAKREQVPLLDQYASYAAALVNGPNMLSCHRLPLAEIPPKYRTLVPPEAIREDSPMGGDVVYILDNLLDVHLAKVPGWFKDRHPNQAGYQVIGAQLAKYLAPRIRKRINAAN
jgi:lysophospholipase L1-like esterase